MQLFSHKAHIFSFVCLFLHLPLLSLPLIFFSATPPYAPHFPSSSTGWSDEDNERLIITMKLSWFSAPLGATGRAAAASEIAPSASPLIIRKHEFSRAGNLPAPSQMTVGSCTVYVHAYSVSWCMCERKKLRERQPQVKEEYIFSIYVCVYQMLKLVCVWGFSSCLYLVLFLFSQPLLGSIKVCIIWLGDEIINK